LSDTPDAPPPHTSTVSVSYAGTVNVPLDVNVCEPANANCGTSTTNANEKRSFFTHELYSRVRSLLLKLRDDVDERGFDEVCAVELEAVERVGGAGGESAGRLRTARAAPA